MDERSQSVLTHVLGNIAERNTRCLTIKIEKRGDLLKEARGVIAPMYQNMLYQCADFRKSETAAEDQPA